MTQAAIDLRCRIGASSTHTGAGAHSVVLTLALLDARGNRCAEVERHYRGTGAEVFARNDQRALRPGSSIVVRASHWRIDALPVPRLVLEGNVEWELADGGPAAPPAATTAAPCTTERRRACDTAASSS